MNTKHQKLRALVIPAKGLGDALLMMISSHQLRSCGYAVDTFHPAFQQLSQWFPAHSFLREVPWEALPNYDLIIVENDNGSIVKRLTALRPKIKLSVFYPTYQATKHGTLDHLDCKFESTLPMADNIAAGTATLLTLPQISKNNGLNTPAQPLLFPKRVIIHPFSSQPKKNWSLTRYFKLSEELLQRGFEPLFVMSEQELNEERFRGRRYQAFSDLASLAKVVGESGYMIGNDSLLGHLASNLGVSTLIIADCSERMQLWRPGWKKGDVITSPRWLPNWKGFRIKENHWQKFIFVDAVLQRFLALVEC